MLPALPTGRQCTSGASPSASMISNAAVFWPSRRSGFTELTRATGWSTASLRASSRQSSKLPSTCSSLAPCTRAWASLPRAILPRGTSTAQVSPARAAYAAGSHSEYRRITPPPSCRNSITAPSRALRIVVPEARKLAVRESSFVALPLDPHHAGDGTDHVHRAQVGDAGGQRRVRRGVRDDDKLGVVAP